MPLLLLLTILSSFSFSRLNAQGCPDVDVIASGGETYTVKADTEVIIVKDRLYKGIQELVKAKKKYPNRLVTLIPAFVYRGECVSVTPPPIDTTPPPVDTIVPPPVDTTPPPPVDTIVPPPVDTTLPPAVPYKFIPASQVARWRVMRDANDPWWQQAVNWCGKTGTGSEGYGDSGLWCAIIAVTNDDAVSANKAIGKLLAIVPDEYNDNTRREQEVEYILKRDMLNNWMTAAQKQTFDAAITRWQQIDLYINTPQYKGGTNPGDSDQTTGTACGTVLYDLFYGTKWTDSTERTRNIPFGGMQATGTSGTLINTIARYVQVGYRGEFIESVEYNPGTLSLLAMCNMGVKNVLGRDVVPGVAQLITDQGTSLAARVTPDLKVETQWGDEQEPRALWRYRFPIALSMSSSPYAAWTLQQTMAAKWPSASNLMARGLLLATQTAPQPFSDPFVWYASGMGMVTWRHGNALSWMMAMPITGVDHTTQDPMFNFQVYKDGWLQTGPIGYGGPKWHTVNGPVYAGLGSFSKRVISWADSGNGWVALAGYTQGDFTIPRNPKPPEFLHYGGVVTVMTQVNGWEVVIVRDSVDMEDPRTLPNFAGYRDDGTYPHQTWINAFDGKFWRIWHTPQAATVNGTDLSWPVPGGTAIVKTFGAGLQTGIYDESTLNWGNSIRASEVKWQVRVHADSPVMFSVWMAGAGTPPTVSRSGDTVVVGNKSITVTSASVTVQ